MRITRSLTIQLDGRELAVTIRELTIGEWRAWLLAQDPVPDGISNLAADLVSLYTDGAFGVLDLLQLCDLNPADLDSLPPSDLDKIVAAAREVNKAFFAASKGRLSQLPTPLPPSNESAAVSSAADTSESGTTR